MREGKPTTNITLLESKLEASKAAGTMVVRVPLTRQEIIFLLALVRENKK